MMDGVFRRVLSAVVMAAVCSAGVGCGALIHSVAPPQSDLVDACKTAPKCARDRVYVFFIHGMDPFDWANLTGLCEYVQSLGFNKTYYGQLYHTVHFEHELCRIHEREPDAHFVLVGFSFGANMVRDVAQYANERGIPIDLLVYLGGNTLDNTPEDQPENVGRIINILASGCIWNGAEMERADNLHVVDVWHFGSPTHPKTLELLAEALSQVAANVPVPEPDPRSPMPFDEMQTPRPVMDHVSARPPGWNFLQPVSRLKMMSGSEPAPEAKPKLPDPERIAQR